MHGPWAPEEGHRFDPRSLLLDPYANALIESAEWQKETPEFGVIFNHTAEGGDNGPTISFRGLDNSTYYMLEPVGHGYIDYTGCGNILSRNHPVIWSLIVAPSLQRRRGFSP